MDKFIKYKRVEKTFKKDANENEYNTQDFFDDVIKEGFEVIYYREEEKENNILKIVLFLGKRGRYSTIL
ncbi:MAG TPA: hypothetical protein PLN85_01080 [archaeon]|jgi:hypothetical protein|nr:hypothetical protein [archaeon]